MPLLWPTGYNGLSCLCSAHTWAKNQIFSFIPDKAQVMFCLPWTYVRSVSLVNVLKRQNPGWYSLKTSPEVSQDPTSDFFEAHWWTVSNLILSTQVGQTGCLWPFWLCNQSSAFLVTRQIHNPGWRLCIMHASLEFLEGICKFYCNKK